MRVRFEIDVERAAAGLVPGVLEGAHFGVLHAIVGVNTRAHNTANRVDDDRSDEGIGRGQAETLPSEVKRAV